MEIRVLDYDWACPDCSDQFIGYFAVTTYHNGTWTCPKCWCNTSSPVDDALIQMDTAYALYECDYDMPTIYRFADEDARNDFVSDSNNDFECSAAIPATMAHRLHGMRGIPIVDYWS